MSTSVHENSIDYGSKIPHRMKNEDAFKKFDESLASRSKNTVVTKKKKEKVEEEPPKETFEQ